MQLNSVRVRLHTRIRAGLVAAGIGAIVALAGAPALAADIVYKAPPPPPPVWSWTGFYLGLNAGAVVNDSSYNTYPTGCYIAPAPCAGGPPLNPFRSASATFNGAALTGGVQAGYNWQTGRMVWGIEADWNGTGQNQTINQSIVLPAPPFAVGNFLNTTSEKMNWFGTVRGRVGFLATPSLLLYGTGGLAYGHVSSSTTDSFTATPDVYNASVSTTRTGWTAGAGTEWMVAPKWSLKAEYLYVDLGTLSYTVPCVNGVASCTAPVPPPTYQTDLRLRDNIFRVGVNYRFNWGGCCEGPVVTKD